MMIVISLEYEQTFLLLLIYAILSLQGGADNKKKPQTCMGNYQYNEDRQRKTISMYACSIIKYSSQEASTGCENVYKVSCILFRRR